MSQVGHICSNEDLLGDYDQLFTGGYQSVDEAQAEFARAFGESFEYIDPVRRWPCQNALASGADTCLCVRGWQTMAELMRQIEISTEGSGPDLTQRRGICSSSAFASSMSLDMVSARAFPGLQSAVCGQPLC